MQCTLIHKILNNGNNYALAELWALPFHHPSDEQQKACSSFSNLYIMIFLNSAGSAGSLKSLEGYCCA